LRANQHFSSNKLINIDLTLEGTLVISFENDYLEGAHEKVLNRLVENGDTVVIIEHNLDVIKTADHIIDLGPEGGEGGGTIVGTGTPEEIAENKDSYTGAYLKPVLKRDTIE